MKIALGTDVANVEYRDNQAMVKMSKLARRTCNATDAEIAAAAGFSL